MKSLLARLNGERTKKTPLWLMRQAGRYLPEYKEIRKTKDDFMAFCLDPCLASQATLQPIERFGLDGAILFSDILVVPYALGKSVCFEHGPKLACTKTQEDIKTLVWEGRKLDPVFETIDRVKEKLEESVTLLGFAGGPWTIACYMIGGDSKNIDQGAARARESKEFIDQLVDIIEKHTTEYLLRQIESGVHAVQIFESHAWLLDVQGFERWVLRPTKRIVSAIKEKYPHVPVIGFPRNVPLELYKRFSTTTGVRALSLDGNICRKKAKEALLGVTLQGNLKPEILVQGGEALDKEIDNIISDWGEEHVFNLGHGVLPDTPVKNVERLVLRIRA